MSSFGPFGVLPSEKMTPFYRMQFVLARRAPRVFQQLLTILLNNFLRRPEKFYDYLLRHQGAAEDHQYLHTHAGHRLVEQSIKGLARQGTKYLAEDLLLIGRDWEIDYGAIQQPVDVWHGEDDHYVSPEYGRWIASQLPNAQYQGVAEAGNYMIVRQYPAIMDQLLGPPR